MIDFNEAGKPIGIELTAQAEVNEEVFNQVLRGLKIEPLEHQDLAPLLAA